MTDSRKIFTMQNVKKTFVRRQITLNQTVFLIFFISMHFMRIYVNWGIGLFNDLPDFHGDFNNYFKFLHIFLSEFVLHIL